MITDIIEYLHMNNLKEGKIYNRTKHLKMWKHKILLLNIERRLLYVKKIEKNKVKEMKTLDLQTYKVIWKGLKDDKHCFELLSVNNFNKNKRVVLGSKNEKYSRDWFY